jgi:uncharacterized repeat protein (TIGR01451 family)
MFTKASRRLLLSGVALAGTIGTAHAQSGSGTAAGTSIANTATASFTVNGAAQTASSNTATFVVDRKVNLTVVSTQTAATQVNLGDAGVAASFRVTNNTNGAQDFLLSASQIVPAGILTGTDNYDLNNLKIFVDSNGNGVYDPGADTATFIDELAPDASVAVFIVGDIPNLTVARIAQVGLDVKVAAGGATGTQGSVLTETGLNQDNLVDVVFADTDNDGLLGYDTLRNGEGWAYGMFEVGVHTVSLSVTKSATVLSDGVSTLNPKALPGAIVQYCLTVNNATLTTPAANVSLTDVIPANTTYVPGSINIGGIGSGGVCLTGGVSVADDGSSTGLYTGSFNGSTKTVTATIPLLAGGTSAAASFRVTIN